MLCENCKEKNATSYCQINVDGKLVQKYLCYGCRSLLVKDDELSAEPEFKIKNQYCRNCGTTLKDFIASGCVGCKCCYEEFSLVIEQALKSVQLGEKHQGKVPKRYLKNKEIAECEALIERAMQNNDMVQMNRLLFRLKQLKGGKNA